jgi:hypothetical protein
VYISVYNLCEVSAFCLQQKQVHHSCHHLQADGMTVTRDFCDAVALASAEARRPIPLAPHQAGVNVEITRQPALVLQPQGTAGGTCFDNRPLCWKGCTSCIVSMCSHAGASMSQKGGGLLRRVLGPGERQVGAVANSAADGRSPERGAS